jgi:hypothetical protein
MSSSRRYTKRESERKVKVMRTEEEGEEEKE